MPAAERDVIDLLVIGGGVNGTGIARDAAGRGLSVLLCERSDLASGTSSNSTKLIHGGLRYLEHFQFRLVREALAEREVLLANAPHIIRPLEFVLPHAGMLRPAWMIRAGLFLYDHLGGRRRLPASRTLDLRRSSAGQPLREEYRTGFAYADCWVDDARLVALNALDAGKRGAKIRPRTACADARPDGKIWVATLQDQQTGARRQVRARMIVNAAGPWAREVLVGRLGGEDPRKLRLVKGSHIVVPRQFAAERAYILQNDDRRVVFAIPYEGDFTLIGTTDVPIDGDPANAAIDADEIAYLCRAVNRYFKRQVGADDVVWSYSGVRPLFDDGTADPSAITRDYTLRVDQVLGAPVLSVYGGKITTYRRLAEQALAQIAAFIPDGTGAWTRHAPLPGGDMPGGDFDAFLAELRGCHPDIEPGLLGKLARRHGTRLRDLLGDARTAADLGRAFGGGLYEREVAFLVAHEWAREADDVLWRRTKCGLAMNASEREAFKAWWAGSAR